MVNYCGKLPLYRPTYVKDKVIQPFQIFPCYIFPNATDVAHTGAIAPLDHAVGLLGFLVKAIDTQMFWLKIFSAKKFENTTGVAHINKFTGKTFQATQLTHERFFTPRSLLRNIFFWYLPNWTLTKGSKSTKIVLSKSILYDEKSLNLSKKNFHWKI